MKIVPGMTVRLDPKHSKMFDTYKVTEAYVVAKVAGNLVYFIERTGYVMVPLHIHTVLKCFIPIAPLKEEEPYKIVDVDHENKDALLVIGDHRIFFQWFGEGNPTVVDAILYLNSENKRLEAKVGKYYA